MVRRNLLLLSLCLAMPTHAGPLDEPHLDIVPRTSAEQKRINDVTAPPLNAEKSRAFEVLSGGAATITPKRAEDAFRLPSGNMAFDRKLDFELGNAMFEKLWVSSPSSTRASDGLGPLYNARSCARCHIRDGRGHPPEPGDDKAVSMFLRIGIPLRERQSETGIPGYHTVDPDPVYGRQLQDFSLVGLASEYRLAIDYEEIPVALSGNEKAFLQKPTYRAENLGYGPLHEDTVISPRLAPQMIGLGLLEAIPATDILVHEDPEDLDGDGISGRANMVWSESYGLPMLGRFGLKAGKATIKDQSASAFFTDIGISTSLFGDPWGDCTKAQSDCRSMPHGDGDVRQFEVDDTGLALVTFYSRNLGVPERRDVDDPQVRRGKALFHDIGCAGCHRPNYVTHRLNNQPEQSFQLIWPYTDLLLHDMGEGLADQLPEARATGGEWRTPPLWGIGLTKAVSGHTRFLHDGRARSLLEAILWHGGEASKPRDAVVSMAPEDRAALVRFLESL
ncbi:di-heme oxidoredictase family protein [uncultured Cohaesibacter sp.]|uniref:di-heme oxidoreductase family protein n=1 Tax=uncultured Cohaesibacter sp. TaxID=1002546 RepID=UPI0029313EB7|nr:di-heme oxidoredictase family protein [uncultured Cohaesibacter sp.]